MSNNRIIYQDWLVELGGEPKEIQNQGLLNILSLEELIEGRFDLFEPNQSLEQLIKTEELTRAVSYALKKLTDEEQEFIIRFYYMGESYIKLSEKTNRSLHKLAALHKRAIKKLKKQLEHFVHKRFGLKPETGTVCPICQSEKLSEINELIKKRDKTKTWRPLLKILREKYQLKFKTVQTIIGHEKYHI